ncbi:MAG TPA: xanthine dehydrogenase family protein subunit M [Pyrinomonadaceae bacterium]|nr:xanthine dehydrogenase family protein subunit M [Pyrinomonadaceae bacterium]
MKPFAYRRALDAADAVRLAAVGDSKFIAGGTNIVDLMKEGIESPSTLVDIQRLDLKTITSTADGGVSIGALAKNTETANHQLIRTNYPLLTKAILAGASPQIRNMATNGGNLMQRPRCTYFYDISMPCNKRQAGSGCGAIDGLNKYSAIFGWSDSCVAVHPSDMCVALTALDAVVKVRESSGKIRSIKFADFHRLPLNQPQTETNLRNGELIVSIELPKPRFATNYQYLKLRDRASYAFALVSVAAAYETKGGIITDSTIVLGGVAHKPWRAVDAEKALKGKRPSDEVFAAAGEAAIRTAKPLSGNGYKLKLTRNAVKRALVDAMKMGGAA